MNPTRNHELLFDPWPLSVGWGSGVAMSCGVVHRFLLDPTLLWLWCRPVATAPIQPLSWELPYDVGGCGPKRKKKKKTLLANRTFATVFKNSYFELHFQKQE